MAEAEAGGEPALADILGEPVARHLGRRPVRRPDRDLRTLYVFFLIRHERRGLLHFNVTASPTAAWIWHQLLEATPWGRQPTYLIHDRDAVYGSDFDRQLASLGISGVRTPVRPPKANAVAGRIVRTIRTECLDHLIVIDERHLRAMLAEVVDYYNRDRPHCSLGLKSPLPSSVRARGRVLSRPVFGRLAPRLDIPRL